MYSGPSHSVRAASRLHAALGACLVALTLGLAGCESPVGPRESEDDTRSPPDLGSTTFVIEDLGSLNRSTSGAHALNRHGDIAGFTETETPPGEIHAFVWRSNEGMRDLGTIAEGDWSIGFDLDRDGRVVGFSATRPSGAGRHAVLWMPDGRSRDLGELDGDATVATAINDEGQVAGTSYAATETGGITPHRAFLWTEGEGMKSLGTLPGTSESWAEDLDRNGRVVGSSGGHAFLWSPDEGMRDLGTLGGPYSAARAINDRGQVVGVSETADGRFEAFLWTEEDGMRSLGAAGGERSAATGINRWGHVVGDASGSSRGTDAFVWSEEEGMRTLEALGSSPASGDALGINDSLVIVGSSLNEALDERAVRWLPSREGTAAVRRQLGSARDREPTNPASANRGSGGLETAGSDPLARLQARLGARWRGAAVVRPSRHHPERPPEEAERLDVEP